MYIQTVGTEQDSVAHPSRAGNISHMCSKAKGH